MTGLLGRLASRATGQGTGGPPALRAAVPSRFAPPEGAGALGGEIDFSGEVVAETEAQEAASGIAAEREMTATPSPSRTDSPQAERPVQTAVLVRTPEATRGPHPVGEHRPITSEIHQPSVPERDVPQTSVEQSKPAPVPREEVAQSRQTSERPSPEAHTEEIETIRTEVRTEAVERIRTIETEVRTDPRAPAAQTPAVQPILPPSIPEGPVAPPRQAEPADPVPPLGLTIGRIDVVFEAPTPPPVAPRRKGPERTRGFDKYARARLGQRG